MIPIVDMRLIREVTVLLLEYFEAGEGILMLLKEKEKENGKYLKKGYYKVLQSLCASWVTPKGKVNCP